MSEFDLSKHVKWSIGELERYCKEDDYGDSIRALVFRVLNDLRHIDNILWERELERIGYGKKDRKPGEPPQDGREGDKERRPEESTHKEVGGSVDQDAKGVRAFIRFDSWYEGTEFGLGSRIRTEW